MATNQTIIDLFAETGNNPVVTAQHLIDLQNALAVVLNLEPADVTPDVYIDFLYNITRNHVIKFKRNNTSLNWG